MTGLADALAGKAAASHGHAVADVTGLQAALDAKAPAEYIRHVITAEAKANDNSVQNWFADSGGVDLDANSTYEFEGELRLATGTTTASVSVRFASIGASSTIRFSGLGSKTAMDAGNAAVRHFTDTRAATSVQATAAATGGGACIWVRGIVRVGNVSGVRLVPQFAFSVAPGGTNEVLGGTRMKVRKIGSNLFINNGWS